MSIVPPADGPSLVWILSGMSGAGKATALRALERAGVDCVDNLPADLVDGFAALPRTSVAVAVVDARQTRHLDGFESIPGTRCLFLDARDDVLVRRMSDSTRPHPLLDARGGTASVHAERAVLEQLRAAADVVLDTSDMTPHDLEERVVALIVPDERGRAAPLTLTLSSFGFKYGPQLDADWIVDSRLMPNPFWQPELRPLTGLDAPVRDFVLQQHEAKELLHRLREDLRWALPLFRDHRRRFLHVAIGCTGGRHRSVVLVEELARTLDAESCAVVVQHRDVRRPDPRT